MDTPPALSVLARLRDAINAHDLEAMVACFAADYDSTFPAHPGRAFRGREQVRANWAQILGGIPDLHTTLVRAAADGETVWAEWEWRGTRRDSAPFHQRGVTLLGVRAGEISWGRLYMEPVEEGDGTDAAVRRTVHGSADA